MKKQEAILKLAAIAIKAHSTNPSPVDIKVELAELPLEVLHKIQEDANRAIEENNNNGTDEL